MTGTFHSNHSHFVSQTGGDDLLFTTQTENTNKYIRCNQIIDPSGLMANLTITPSVTRSSTGSYLHWHIHPLGHSSTRSPLHQVTPSSGSPLPQVNPPLGHPRVIPILGHTSSTQGVIPWVIPKPCRHWVIYSLGHPATGQPFTVSPLHSVIVYTGDTSTVLLQTRGHTSTVQHSHWVDLKTM